MYQLFTKIVKYLALNIQKDVALPLMRLIRQSLIFSKRSRLFLRRYTISHVLDITYVFIYGILFSFRPNVQSK